MLAALLRGTNLGPVTIEYVGNTKVRNELAPVTFMQLALDNVMFSALSLSTDGNLPSISASLNFTGFSQTVWEFNRDGIRGDAVTFGYDIARGVAHDGKLAAAAPGFGRGNLDGSLTGATAGAAAGDAFAPCRYPSPRRGS